ncbi:beta-ketoacyl synthase N-terminal-like domain-containing protein [Neobacillus sp. LXY-1]|uniref:beta-ketoacyl synthase N-terminal-like domain-containing protein n=1 Tax=Neobacillus sp. LXY-1 TaxID=3379133 RepID=UPI003EE2C123
MKVLITGYGIKAPKIQSVSDFKDVLEHGKIILEMIEFNHGLQLVCGKIDADLTALCPKVLKRYPRTAQMVIGAAHDAIKMAHLINRLQDKRVGVIIGTSGGNITEVEKWSVKLQKNNQISPLSIGNMNANALSTAVSSFFDLHGMSLTLCNSCTASTDAINLGKTLIEAGQFDICIVGGVESTLTDVVVQGFSKLRLTSRETDPAVAGGPFSDDSGFVLSEGAGVLVLESEHSAQSRNVIAKGWLEGAYMNQDGISIYHSDSSGARMIEALRQCLNGQVPDYINSQALGIKENDTVETIVHRTLFGHSVPITSIKGMTGHYLGATGAIQAISSLISIEHQFIPPTIKWNLTNYPDLPIVTETKYEEVNKVAITSHGYGGNNSCILLSKL